MSNTTNEGIQAEVIKADVLAVGRGASAMKTVVMKEDQREELLTALQELHRGVDELIVDRRTRTLVEKECDKLKGATGKEQIDREEVEGVLQNIARTFKSVGVILSDAVALREPLMKIGALLRIPLTFLGLA